jgi:thiol:disulfide interchange protein DsbD
MKKLLLLLLTCIYTFAFTNTILEPEEAFKPHLSKTDEKIIFDIQLGQDIYLYDEQLKVEITKPIKKTITPLANFPKPVEYDEFMVHFELPTMELLISDIQKNIDSKAFELVVKFQGCSKAGLCYAPMSETITVGEINQANKDVTQNTSAKTNEALNETDAISTVLQNKSMWIVLATFFGFGLLLSFTPCVFPMIPILSSIIVNAGSKTQMSAKKGFLFSLVYVLAMSVAYTIAGVLAGLFGANLQAALQNPYVLVVFAAVFVALAFSMFGYYRMELPHWLQAKIHNTTSKQEGHGITGVAIMGFLSALIVGPCVAPPLAGALVYIGQTGDAILGGMALFVMSLGMGIPLLAIGAGAGKFMPKPGGWMESITRIFGILMLAIAIWMLERVIPDYTLYLWAFLLIGSAVYLQQYQHLLVKTLTAVLFIYGATAFVGAMSGGNNILKPLERLSLSDSNMSVQSELNWVYVNNLEELNSAIKASKKPVMLDFYAQWCVSCKELENITFKDAQVIEKLKSFTLIKADVTDNTNEHKALQKHFNVFGPPALIFFDENNQEIKQAQIIGFKTANEFLEIVNKSF